MTSKTQRPSWRKRRFENEVATVVVQTQEDFLTKDPQVFISISNDANTASAVALTPAEAIDFGVALIQAAAEASLPVVVE